MKFSCCLVGNGSLLIQCGDFLLARGHQIVGVASSSTSVRKWAADNKIEVRDEAASLEQAFVEPFDYLFSIINYTMLSQKILDRPRKLAVNFHDGPLPRYAGLYATSWAILNGESEHGITWHAMLSGPDTGQILSSKAVAIDEDETAYSLNIKCFSAAMDAFKSLVIRFESGDQSGLEQDISNRTYFGKNKRPPLFLDWTGGASQIERLARATDYANQPNPFGRSKISTERGVLLVESAINNRKPSTSVPGTIISVADDLRVATRDYDVVLRLKALNGAALDGSSLRNRYGLVEGVQLPSLNRRELDQAADENSQFSAREAFWIKQLDSLTPAVWPLLTDGASVVSAQVDAWFKIDLSDIGLERHARDFGISSQELRLSLLTAFLHRVGREESFDIGLTCVASAYILPVPTQLPLKAATLADGIDLETYAKATALKLRESREGVPYLADLPARNPAINPSLSAGPQLPIEVFFAEPQRNHSHPRGRLVVAISELDEAIQFLFHLADADPAQMRALLESLKSFTIEWLSLPTTPLMQVPMVRKAERDELVQHGNETERAYPSGYCFHELFARQVQATPDAIAIQQDGQHISYRELSDRVEELCSLLNRNGVRKGHFVAVLLERTPDLVAALLAVMRLGAAYLPLDKAYPRDRIAYMLEDASVQLIVTASSLVDSLPGGSVPTLLLDEQGAVAQVDQMIPTTIVDVLEPAYLIYTSGSTGRPKGVVVHHQGLTNLLCSHVSYPGFKPGDLILCLATVSFDIFVAEAFAPLICGATVEIVSSREAADGFSLRDKISKLKPTHLQATPATWRMLIAAGWNESSELKMISTGEALPRELAEQLLLRSPNLWNCYGPTETTVFSSIARIRSTDKILIGRPLSNTQIHILDAQGELVPQGVTGELYIGGDGVATGYLNQPDLTAQRFVDNHIDPVLSPRLYRTGDLARRLSSGEIEYLGRMDTQVKIRGFRIEIGEIEYALSKISGVRDAVVTVHEDGVRGNSLRAFIVAEDPSLTLSVTDLRRLLSDHLPNYMVPAHFTFLESFPLTPSGKVDRRALATPTLPPAAGPSDPETTGNTEGLLFSIWASQLGHRNFTTNDNFFDVGGDSVLLISLLADVGRRFGRTPTALDMLRFPTVKTMACFLEEVEETPAHPEFGNRASLRRARLGKLVPRAATPREYYDESQSAPNDKGKEKYGL